MRNESSSETVLAATTKVWSLARVEIKFDSGTYTLDDDEWRNDDDLNWWCIDENEIMKYWIDVEDEEDREVVAGVRLYKENRGNGSVRL